MEILVINNKSKHIEEIKNSLDSHEIDIVNFNEIEDYDKYDLIILSGSSIYSVKIHNREFEKEIDLIKNCDKPILGICFGFQLICHSFGEEVEKMRNKKKGVFTIEKINQDPIIKDCEQLEVYEGHRWRVANSNNLKCIARSKHGIEIVKHNSKNIYGFQFHPEVNKNNEGQKLLNNFIKIIDNC